VKSRVFWVITGFIAFTVLVAVMCHSAQTAGQ